MNYEQLEKMMRDMRDVAHGEALIDAAAYDTQLAKENETTQRALIVAAHVEAIVIDEIFNSRKLVAIVKIDNVSSGRVYFHSTVTRSDITEVFTNVISFYKNTNIGGKSSIAINEYVSFRDAITKLPNVTFVIPSEFVAELEYMENGPDYKFDYDEKSKMITCLVHPNCTRNIVTRVDGATYNGQKKLYVIPRLEAYKIPDVFDALDANGIAPKVFYSDTARDIITSELSARISLDAIALATDADYEVKFAASDFAMRPFQRVGAKFLELAGGRGILADEMGLGKTIQSLALAIKNNYATIVVCPANLKINWAREICRLTGKVPKVAFGSAPSNADIIELLIERPQFIIINYDIVGRKEEFKTTTVDAEGYSHEKYNEKNPWIDVLNMAKYDMTILDEAHYIKNPDSQRTKGTMKLKTPKLICMTGTPVLNRPGEMWPMLNMTYPDLFPSYASFLNTYTYDGKSARNVKQLREMLKRIMIRRLKKDVVAELPPIVRINEYHELSPKARKLYTKILDGVYDTLNQSSGEIESKNITSILTQIMRMKQVSAIDKATATADLAIQLYDSAGPDEKYKKVLIFTQFKPIAFKLSQLLGNEARCFVNRSANGKEFTTIDIVERQRLVDKFQEDNDDVKFLIVTEKTAKEGLNITAAGSVIFNDLFWTPAGHEQGEARAYGRLGDLHSVTSYYMQAENTIDEWIMALLMEKMQIITEVVEGVQESRATDTSIAMALIQKLRGH